ncbi:MAG: L-seryl-tRNA(Sec) selenium transferase, partial [Thermomicrobiales bacterium]
MSPGNRQQRAPAFRHLPSVSSVVEEIRRDGLRTVDDRFLVQTVQSAIADARQHIGAGEQVTRQDIVEGVTQRLSHLETDRLATVVNATGVILHTNLGRAPVSAETAAAMARVAASNVALEIDPATNERGGRMSELTALMQALTGAEATLVVNNNAAAVLLVLSALAAGREVIVSRGEAVEIGGGFRIPDVLRQSGATMVEVGTTNRTYSRDYQAAVSDRTAAVLTVHSSNFRVEGFVATPDLRELVSVAHDALVPMVDDLGSGSILQPSDYGLGHERTIGECIASGVDIVTASGDKLLGGPQAGLICGRADLIARIEQHPLARAVRAGKSVLAGVAATLRHYVRGEAKSAVPVWRMITAPEEDIHLRAVRLESEFQQFHDLLSVLPVRSTIGGGSLPGATLPSWALAICHDDLDSIAAAFRTGTPGIFGRI